jgi:hypothetical protein
VAAPDLSAATGTLGEGHWQRPNGAVSGLPIHGATPNSHLYRAGIAIAIWLAMAV